MNYTNEAELKRELDKFEGEHVYVAADFELPSNQCDKHNRAQLAHIFGLFEQIANMHIDLTGFSNILDRGYSWVLNRIALEINDRPKKEEKIRIYTWESKATKVGLYRDYMVFRENGDAIIAARSFWSVIEVANRSIVATHKVFGDEANSFITGIYATDNKLKSLKKSLPDISNLDPLSFNRVVGYSDIDINNHVNNTRYIGMIVDALDFLNVGHKYNFIEVNYSHELLRGDEVKVDASLLEEDETSYTVGLSIKIVNNILQEGENPDEATDACCKETSSLMAIANLSK